MSAVLDRINPRTPAQWTWLREFQRVQAEAESVAVKFGKWSNSVLPGAEQTRRVMSNKLAAANMRLLEWVMANPYPEGE